MNLSINQLRTLSPLNNLVIVKPLVDPNKCGDLMLVQYDEFKSAPVVCTVIAPPRKLIFGKRKVFHESIEELDVSQEVKARMWQHRMEAQFTETTLIEQAIPGSMMWKTKVQVKENDVVWVNPNAITIAQQNQNTITCDGELYYLIPYESLHLKNNGKKVEMLNGYVLAELVEEDPDWHKRMEKMGLVIPSQLRKQEFKDRIGIIRYIGEPTEYLFNDGRYDHPEIKVGDTVLFKYKINRRLEPGMKYFAKDNADLIVTRRCNIQAIL